MVFDKVAELIAESKDLDVSEIKLESTFADLGVDSLDTAELVMSLEDEFGVSIEITPELKTVGDIVKLIDEGTNG